MIIVCSLVCSFCFFFKQKTAYEMRISDWSSDVCSSDLVTWRQFATNEHVKCRKALLPIQQNAHSTLLIIVLVRAFKFRRIVCLPSQHCTGGILDRKSVV